MPANYDGDSSNITGGELGQVTIAVPVDGDSANAASVQAPLEELSDYSQLFLETHGPMIAMAGNNDTAIDTAGQFLDIGYTEAVADTTEKFFVVPIACKVSRLTLRATEVLSNDAVVVVRKNGVDQALTVTGVAAGAGTPVMVQDLVNSFTCVAGDRISFKIGTTGLAPTGRTVQPLVSVLLTSA